MISLDALLARPGIAVVYDGECPFCASYVGLIRLRDAAGPVELIDARSQPALVRDLKDRDIELDKSMAVVYGGAIHAGSDAIHVLSHLSSGSGLINRGLARLFRNRAVAEGAYPYLRAGRNLALRLLGRKAIGASQVEMRESSGTNHSDKSASPPIDAQRKGSRRQLGRE